MTRRRLGIMAGSGLLLSACGAKRSRVANVPPSPRPDDSSNTPPPSATAPNNPARQQPINAADYSPETGIASWYGHPYHGRASASGEIYDMEQMTAAHRTLAFGTVVHVENLDNGLATDVRINDRGPFVGNRIIDLSHAAAGAIQMVGPGVAHVRLTITGGPPVPEPSIFAIQVAAFANRDNADRMQARMRQLYGAATLRLRTGTPAVWRVLVGKSPDTLTAETLARQIREEQNVPEAFVVRLDPAVNPGG